MRGTVSVSTTTTLQVGIYSTREPSDVACDDGRSWRGGAGVGGKGVGEPVLSPIECADAVLLAKLELRRAGGIGHEIITAKPGTFTVFVHEECGGPAIGREETFPPPPGAERAGVRDKTPGAGG